MDFAALVMFLSLYYLKPQEWMPLIGVIKPVQLAMGMGILALFQRPQGLRLKDMLRTPHDWLVLAYFCWMIFTSPTPWDIFKMIQVNVVTYFVFNQSLTTIARMKNLLLVWGLLIFIIATLAVMGDFGIDPLGLGSKELTEWKMKGRLMLNISIFNNPNGLAHSVVPLVPLIYFLLIWKRVFLKAFLMLEVIPLWCIFLTESKGAILSGFTTLLATLTFGRPKIVQIIIVVAAVNIGYGALYMLPRMNELKKTKTDPAIQGRVEALKHGLLCMQRNFTGVGYTLFQESFYKANRYNKAAHNAYNQNGAELGRVGLGLFVGLLYCCGRTLVSAKTGNVEEERVRRALFCLLISYAVSCWMVDFAYRTTFFVLVAATGAFHRHMAGITQGIQDAVKKEEAEADVPFGRHFRRPELPPASALAPLPDVPLVHLAPDVPRGVMPPGRIPVITVAPKHEELEPEESGTISWRRFGFLDVAAIVALTWLVEKYWIRLIHTM